MHYHTQIFSFWEKGLNLPEKEMQYHLMEKQLVLEQNTNPPDKFKVTPCQKDTSLSLINILKKHKNAFHCEHNLIVKQESFIHQFSTITFNS